MSTFDRRFETLTGGNSVKLQDVVSGTASSSSAARGSVRRPEDAPEMRTRPSLA